MKTRIIVAFAAALVMLTVSRVDANAQRCIVVPQGSNINALIPGAYLRPISKSENSCMIAARATGYSAAALTVGAAGCAIGAVFYDIEAKKVEGSDWYGHGAEDAVVCKRMAISAGALAGSAAALGICSLCLKCRMNKKTIVKTETGGFVVEF